MQSMKWHCNESLERTFLVEVEYNYNLKLRDSVVACDKATRTEGRNQGAAKAQS